MMRISEEQKAILDCYEGGRTKILREMRAGADELRTTGEDPEMLEILEDLMVQLETCTNKEFFQAKRGRLIDTEDEEAELPEEGGHDE